MNRKYIMSIETTYMSGVLSYVVADVEYDSRIRKYIMIENYGVTKYYKQLMIDALDAINNDQSFIKSHDGKQLKIEVAPSLFG